MFKRMTTPVTRTALASTMVLALAVGSAAGASAGTAAKAPAESDVTIDVTIDDGPEGARVSFSAPGATLDRVLGAIAQEAGFRLVIEGDLSRQPHAGRMSAVPLDRALRRLVGDTSMIVLFEPAGGGGRRVAEVRLYARPRQ